MSNENDNRIIDMTTTTTTTTITGEGGEQVTENQFQWCQTNYKNMHSSHTWTFKDLSAFWLSSEIVSIHQLCFVYVCLSECVSVCEWMCLLYVQVLLCDLAYTFLMTVGISVFIACCAIIRFFFFFNFIHHGSIFQYHAKYI